MRSGQGGADSDNETANARYGRWDGRGRGREGEGEEKEGEKEGNGGAGGKRPRHVSQDASLSTRVLKTDEEKRKEHFKLTSRRPLRLVT